MHPHWETTDDGNNDDESVAIRVVEKINPSDARATPAAKRSGAALFGISLIALAGFFSFGGLDLLPAQVGVSAIKVTITDTAVSPTEVLVKGGRRINFVNASGIPHILSFNTLKDAKGNSMETTAIFPGSDVSIDIPVDTPDGTYPYVSNTSPTVSGRVIVQKDRLPSSSSSVTYLPYTKPLVSSSSSSSFTPERPIGKLYPSSSNSSATGISASSEMVTNLDTSTVPTNPYSISNPAPRPVDKTIAPVAAVTTHRPVKQPESGTGLWLIVFTGIFSLMIVMKRASVKI